jgi:hypothetical protein
MHTHQKEHVQLAKGGGRRLHQLGALLVLGHWIFYY